jgi:ZIP family zinc transporter
MEFFINLNPVIQAFLATCFTWAMTALGAAVVFTTKKVSRKLLDASLGFSGGVMIAASFWSLLEPSIELSEGKGVPAWFPPAVGFSSGVILLWGMSKILPHLHLGLQQQQSEGIKTHWRRMLLLVLAISLHNIPEGLAVGVTFGAIETGLPTATLSAAIVLAFGIGIQNFPEGLAVSMPLRGEGMSRSKSFWYGQLSALVEPAAGVIGAGAVILIQPLLPYAFSFAAGAMVFVVIVELVPECRRGGNTALAAFGSMIGFIVMMVLDLAFG